MKDINQSLLDKLRSESLVPKVKPLVDWDNSNDFSTDEDLSNYFLSGKINKQLEGNFGTNTTNDATITLDNSNNDFSPKNLNGKWGGNVLTDKPAIIRAGDASEPLVDIFAGLVTEINPNYKGSKVSLKIKDETQKLKGVDCPNKFYHEAYKTDVVKELLDIAGAKYTNETIDTINTKINYNFNGMNIWEAIKKIAKTSWARVYVKNGLVHFKTGMSPDYEQDSAPVYTFTEDDYFTVKEEYTSKDLYNKVTLKSEPLSENPLRPVWQSANEGGTVTEQYNSNDINNNQLQLTFTPINSDTEQATQNVPIIENTLTVVDTTEMLEYTESNGGITVNHNTGLITFNNTSEYPTPPAGRNLSVEYEYKFNILVPNSSREFKIELDDPTVDISNLHVDTKNIDDKIKTVVDAREKKTFKLRNNQIREVEVEEPHTANWKFVAVDGGNRQVSTGTLELERGTYKVRSSYNCSYGFLNAVHANYDMYIYDPSGNLVVHEVVQEDSSLTHDVGHPRHTEVEFTYYDYEYTDIIPENPDVERELEIEADQQTIYAKVTNNSSKNLKLRGYFIDPNKVNKSGMVIMGRPYKKNNKISFTKEDKDSIDAFDSSKLPDINFDLISSRSELKQLGQYLLYQYSTPKTVLNVKAKPNLPLEVGDKVEFNQTDRSTDNHFIVKSIKQNFKKGGTWETDLTLIQANPSSFDYQDDGTPVIEGNTSQSPNYEKPITPSQPSITLLNASTTGNNKIKVSWPEVEDNISHYAIYRKAEGEDNYQPIDEVDYRVTEYIDRGLDYNKRYYYKITCVSDHSVESDKSNSVDMITYLGDIPQSPTFNVDRTDTKIYSNSCTLIWDKVYQDKRNIKDINYEVRLDNNFGSNDNNLLAVTSDNWFTYNSFTGLENRFYIKAIDVNASAYSGDYDSINVTRHVPNTPTFVATNCWFKDEIFLEWNTIDYQALGGYEVRLDENFGADDDNLIYKGMSNKVKVDNPKGNNSYTFYIKAFSVNNLYSTISDSVALTENPPTSPSFISGRSWFRDDLHLEWNDVTEESIGGYELRTDTNFGVDDNGRIYKGGRTSYTFSPEDTLRSETFYIKSYLTSGLYADSYSQITINEEAPNSPVIKNGASWFRDDIHLEWETVNYSALENYEIRTDENFGTDDANLIYRGLGNSLTFENPSSGTRTQTFYIRSLSTSGLYSDTSSTITIDEESPAVPTIKNNKCWFKDKVHLEWDNINYSAFKSYEVRLDTNFGADDSNLIYRGDSDNITIENPIDGDRTHTFYIKSLSTSGYYSTSVASEVTLNETPPATPTFSADSWFRDDIRLKWSGVDYSALAGYEVRLDENFGVEDSNLIYKGNSDTIMFEHPTDGVHEHTFYIRAYSTSDLYSDTSDIITLTEEAPPVPSWDTEDCTIYDTISLSWISVDFHSLKGYEVRTDQNFGVDDSNRIYKGEANYYNFPTPQRNNTFYIKSYSTTGLYSSETAVSIDLDNPVPETPIAPSFMEYFEKIVVSVDDTGISDADLQGYNVYATNTATSEERVITVSSASELAVIEAGEGETFDIQVTAFDTIGESPKSPVVTATTTALNVEDAIPDGTLDQTKFGNSLSDKIDTSKANSDKVPSIVADHYADGDETSVSKVEQLEDEYTVKLQKHTNGTTDVAGGFGLSLDDENATVDFAVKADTFKIFPTDGSGNPTGEGTAVFTVETRDFDNDGTDETKAVLNGDFIAKGTITGEKVDAGSITAREIKAGSLSAEALDSFDADLANITAGSGNIEINSTGMSHIGNAFDLNTDGSGSLGFGGITWDDSGNLTVTGELDSNSGNIAGWRIEENRLRSPENANGEFLTLHATSPYIGGGYDGAGYWSISGKGEAYFYNFDYGWNDEKAWFKEIDSHELGETVFLVDGVDRKAGRFTAYNRADTENNYTRVTMDANGKGGKVNIFHDDVYSSDYEKGYFATLRAETDGNGDGYGSLKLASQPLTYDSDRIKDSIMVELTSNNINSDISSGSIDLYRRDFTTAYRDKIMGMDAENRTVKVGNFEVQHNEETDSLDFNYNEIVPNTM